MTIRLSLITALAALCCAGPALATDENPGPREESSDRGSEVICQVEKVPGSRLVARRVCLTRNQWRQQQQQLREEMRRAQLPRVGPV